MCFIHKWGKWQEYTVNVPARQITKKWMLCAATEKRQKKVCQKCGMVKDELITMHVIG